MMEVLLARKRVIRLLVVGSARMTEHVAHCAMLTETLIVTVNERLEAVERKVALVGGDE